MPEQVKRKIEEEIKLLEHELTNELPKEIKKVLKKLRRGWYDMRCGTGNECTSK